VIETLGHLNARRPDRRLDDHRSVGDADGVDGNRIRGPPAIGFSLLFLHEAAERPGIAVATQIDHRLIETNRIDRQPLREQLEHAVIEPEVLDRHDLAAVHRHTDVFHLDAEEQIAAQPFDRQRAVQIQVGLAHDVAAQPVLEPRRLRDDDRGRRRANHERQDEHQHVREPLHDAHSP
jgi:hypothetical protein